ncbi:MAG: hypothetical protein WC843_04030 [Candidatus Gracilibacteria bacterium]|jgi:glycopeptide antibiotics resistance protein
MYLLLLTIAMCLAYVVLYFLFSFFFKNKFTPITGKSFISIFLIIIVSFIAYTASFGVADPELGNRIMHMFGGGFLAFMVCFLVVKDSKLAINKFQFFIFSFLIVIALGVANEIAEFFLQNFAYLRFSSSINDTWLDLISNVIGALIAAVCFVPFLKRNTKI